MFILTAVKAESNAVNYSKLWKTAVKQLLTAANFRN